MRILRSLSPLFLLLALVSPSLAAAPKKKPAPVKYGIPRLAPGQLWVSSVPVGLEVRVGDGPQTGKVVGRTPVVINRADVGPHVTVLLLRKEYGAEFPSQRAFGDFFAKSNHSGVHVVDGKEEDYLRGLTYEVKLPARQTLIALFVPRSLPLSQAARLYPPGSNFPFSDAAVSKRLAGKGADAKSIPKALGLLHRGGKVILPAGSENWIIAEVTAPGVVDVTDLASRIAELSKPTPSHTP